MPFPASPNGKIRPGAAAYLGSTDQPDPTDPSCTALLAPQCPPLNPAPPSSIGCHETAVVNDPRPAAHEIYFGGPPLEHTTPLEKGRKGDFMPHVSILTEAKQRLEHLRILPATPMRTREISALERVIASGAEPKPARVRRSRSVRGGKNEAVIDNSLADDDESPSKPLREVEHVGAHRRIVIRKEKPRTTTEEDEEKALEKEHQQRVSDIQAAVGLRFRGFS